MDNDQDCSPRYCQSYDSSRDCEYDGVTFANSSVPWTNGRLQGYETFPSSSENQDDRCRSISAPPPHVPCSSRAYTRSMSAIDSLGNARREAPEKAKSRSIGNINGDGEHSIEFSSANEEDDVQQEVYCCGFTKRQFKCGVALSLISILDVMGFSIFSPFFPVVAEEKGLSTVQIGLIFSAFSMAGIFGSIVTGTLLVRVGAKFIIMAGFFWSAGATICFGFLDKTPPEMFFYLCFACRILMGIGNAAAFTALFAVIFQEFSDRALTIIGVSESLCSIGGICGPLIGGGLYTLGGYVVPFAFLGGMQLLVLVITGVLIPPVAVQRQVNAVSPAWLLLNLHGFFSALFVILSFTVNSFITANLSLFLVDSFNVSTFMVGVFMLVFSIFYGISTPVFGYIADSRNSGAHVMTVCCFLGGLVMSLFGPADFWRDVFGWTGPQQWQVYVCISVLGALMGGLIMPTFGEMILAAKQMRLQSNELAEYGMVSGLWNTAFSIGDIMGPTVGGAIVQKMDFQNTLALLGAMMSGLALIKAVHLIYLSCKKRESTDDDDGGSTNVDGEEERKSLLRPDSPAIRS